MKILIAEDSVTQAERLRHVLSRTGYDVCVAPNGRVALELAAASPPDLVISDVVMPEVDGYELARRLKTDPAHRGVPIILVTTLSEPADVVRGLECGADGFVVKPYEAEYLLARVRSVLANRGDREEAADAGVEIDVHGSKHVITAGRRQILNLLLSTYDAAVARNKELQRSRELLRTANARLGEANASLEAFAYSASHDLRAPLRHISGYVGILQQELGGQITPSAQRLLNEINGASRRMAQLIVDLLEFSRAERAELKTANVDLARVVGTCIEALERAGGDRRVEWKIAPLPLVVGDPALLERVFMNLLGNALKYTARRADACIQVGVETANAGEVVVFVRDNGAGFDMQYAGKLFQPFQRLHGADEFEGTGIGLATVRRVVERHGGRVWAEAAVDRGATVYVSLPRGEPQAESPAASGVADRRPFS